MKKVVALVLSLMMVLSLTACGSKDYTGKYTLTSMKSEEESMEVKKGDDYWKLMFPEDGDTEIPYIELKKDDKFTMVFDESGDGTYKVDGEDIELKADDDTIKGTIKDDKITVTIEKTELVFELEKK